MFAEAVFSVTVMGADFDISTIVVIILAELV